MTGNRLAWLSVVLLSLAACRETRRPGATSPDAGAAPARPGAAATAAAMFERRESLTLCTMFDLLDDRPTFAGVQLEGDVAFYGLLLQAAPDPALATALLAAAREGLWEYHRGYGATSEDSALVIEGLLAAGVDPATLRDPLSRIVERYYDRDAGCFATVVGGRAAYWKGCSGETTAHIAYLLQRVDPDRFAAEVTACTRYIEGTAAPDGGWTSRWFPSRTLPTYFALRLLAAFGDTHRETLAAGTAYLLRTQSANGDWSGSIIETAAALLALRAVVPTSPVIPAAAAWLAAAPLDARPEPVLFYWFEDQGRRRFFSCHDRGPIRAAWRALALAAE